MPATSSLNISYAISNSTIEESLHQPCEMPLRKELKVQQKRGVSKAFKIVSREALMNVMYCYLKSYSCTSNGTSILPEVS